jgi:hypothetical protein
MAWIEDITKRTQKSKRFYDANTGKWKAEFAIADIHYRDGTAWQDIDETIINDGTGGFDKKCDKTRHIFRVGTGGNQRWQPRRDAATEYVDITQIEYHGVTGNWKTLNLPAAVWKQQGASWDMDYLYAEIINTWHQVKTSFIMQDNRCPTRLRFAISLVGLTLNTTTWEFTSITDGLVWGSIPPPKFTDANELDCPVTTTYSGGYIEWSVDVTGKTYPISSMSLTFTDGTGGDVDTRKNTYIRADTPDTEYSAWTTLYLGLRGGITQDQRILIRFDLSEIPTGSTCASATLTLYCYGGRANAPYNLYEIRSEKTGWVETATWNHYEGTSDWTAAGCSDTTHDRQASPIAQLVIPDPSVEGYLNTTNFDLPSIEAWFGASNNGLIIIDADTTDWYYTSFNSGDYWESIKRPKFVVEYEEPTGETNIVGSTCWGHTSGVQEGNVRTFTGNWTGTGIVSGSSDSEKILLSTGNYMQSEIVNTGANRIELFQNKYDLSGSGLLKYRSGSNVANCEAAEWQSYTGSFASTGYTQIRVEPT